MTPKVRDILVKARREIHAATALHANLVDSQVLFTLDQLITADAVRGANQTVDQADMICHLDTAEPDPEASRDTEKIARPEPRAAATTTGSALDLTTEERAELQRLRKADESSTRIIQGLLDKVKKLEGRA